MKFESKYWKILSTSSQDLHYKGTSKKLTCSSINPAKLHQFLIQVHPIRNRTFDQSSDTLQKMKQRCKKDFDYDGRKFTGGLTSSGAITTSDFTLKSKNSSRNTRKSMKTAYRLTRWANSTKLFSIKTGNFTSTSTSPGTSRTSSWCFSPCKWIFSQGFIKSKENANKIHIQILQFNVCFIKFFMLQNTVSSIQDAFRYSIATNKKSF